MEDNKKKSLLQMMEEEKIREEAQKKSSLEKLDEEKNQEEVQKNPENTKEVDSTRTKTSVLTIADNSGKDKQISAKVNLKVYGLFTQINKAQGISNNSALNMLISRYVRENKGILDDDDSII